MAKTLVAAVALAAATVGASSPSVDVPSWPTTVPFWPQYPSRNVQVLTGTWDFGFSTQGDALTIPYSTVVSMVVNKTQVPGSFDVTPPGTLGPRGNAFFRSVHACTPGNPALLKFYAVNFFARVFVDGNDIGSHFSGGYTPFEMAAPACGSSGLREVAVIVNNALNLTLCPTCTGGDFFFYSGIIRPVIVTEIPAKTVYWIDRVEPLSKDYERGLIDIRVVMAGNVEAANGIVHIAYGFNGAAVGNSVGYALANNTAVIPSVAVPNFKLWMLGQDNTNNLFTLTVEETYFGDSVTTRSAIRVLGVDLPTARLTINGQIVKLRGFNRHTMWPDTGAAVTTDQEAADLEIIKTVNANYVRGAHYPQSQSWLDMCDEAGIAIWEETLGPGTSTGNMLDPFFMSNHLAAVASMVAHSFHHPSVIFHAFFNEGPSNNPVACVGYERSSSLIKQMVGYPQARLVTWASNQVDNDQCFAYADVISFNNYPGWYGRPGNVSYVADYWGSKIQWAADNYPDTPLTISETGGGGIFEWTNDTYPDPGLFWSQKYQKNLVTADASFILNSTRVTGLTLWQFAGEIRNAPKGPAGTLSHSPTHPTAQLSHLESIRPHCFLLSLPHPFPARRHQGQRRLDALVRPVRLRPHGRVPHRQPLHPLDVRVHLQRDGHVRAPLRREPQGLRRLLAPPEGGVRPHRRHLRLLPEH
jgi:beta-glucuronidase